MHSLSPSSYSLLLMLFSRIFFTTNALINRLYIIREKLKTFMVHNVSPEIIYKVFFSAACS